MMHPEFKKWLEEQRYGRIWGFGDWGWGVGVGYWDWDDIIKHNERKIYRMDSK